MQLGVGLGLPYNLGKPAAAFSPLDLSPVLWLDASDTSTITEVGGAVSQWDDKSGNGYHVTQGTAALQPTSGTRTINGLNVLDFDGSDWLTEGTVTATQPITVLAVVESDDDLVTVNAYYFDSTNALDRISNRAYTGSRWRLNAGSDQNVNGRTNDPQLHRIVFNGASTTFHIDGSLIGTFNPGTGGLDGITIGAALTLGAPMDGAWAELVIVDGTLSAGEIADTESYLADKWGITI